jgi:hypothetical protein
MTARFLCLRPMYAGFGLVYPPRMLVRWSVGLVCVLFAAAACGSSDDEGSAPKTPPGALPCEGLALDCRLAYADEYDGTFAGDDQGRFTIRVDVLGGISGTVNGDASGAQSATGQVNEFGQIALTLPDGTTFSGQFNADGSSFQGTWTGPEGSGTFSGRSATKAPSGTGGSGGGGGGPGSGGTGNVGPQPTTAEVIAAVQQSCDAAAGCGLVPASVCVGVMPKSLTDCLREELALYQCIIADPCDSLTSCASYSSAMMTCFTNSGTLPSPSGIPALDRATQVCDACRTQGAACGNSFDCYSYALCINDCMPSDSACEGSCGTGNPVGVQLYTASLTCQATSCP